MSREKIINQSKKAFVDALFCLLERESFENITIKQLTLESGYSRRTYYRYFSSKSAILDEMLFQYLNSYHDYLLKLTFVPEDIPNLFIHFLWPHRQRFRLLAKRNLLIPLLTRHITTIVNMLLTINVPWRQKESSNKLQYYYTITYSVGGFYILLDTIFKESLPQNPQQISDSLTEGLKEITIQINN
ncbi:TetR/AcrR family transcriptional regulator [Liquorilactobacillus uvarum]|uniref:TetR/AcrR family transcriptional regulator n=1 Tax=Liquorilactobacillus uvarum TaxID=303240 RepID=UPI0028899CD6|nr:TetR/AcrR family transcriptional regulator [Liquorilactobacillus uvarum]